MINGTEEINCITSHDQFSVISQQNYLTKTDLDSSIFLHKNPVFMYKWVCPGCDDTTRYHHDLDRHKEGIFMEKYRAVQVLLCLSYKASCKLRWWWWTEKGVNPCSYLCQTGMLIRVNENLIHECIIIDRTYWLAAYRQFIHWTYNILGRGLHKIIPSCFVAAVRTSWVSRSWWCLYWL